jgi:hypothetical protein
MGDKVTEWYETHRLYIKGIDILTQTALSDFNLVLSMFTTKDSTLRNYHIL